MIRVISWTRGFGWHCPCGSAQVITFYDPKLTSCRGNGCRIRGHVAHMLWGSAQWVLRRWR